MVYQSPCYPCEYNFYSVDEFGDCKEDICKCPKDKKSEKCWLEQWARAELKEKSNEDY